MTLSMVTNLPDSKASLSAKIWAISDFRDAKKYILKTKKSETANAQGGPTVPGSVFGLYGPLAEYSQPPCGAKGRTGHIRLP